MDYLVAKDEKIGAYIQEIGFIKREVTPDVFETLIRNIIGQQISNKALATVLGRFKNLVGNISPENINKISAEDIQKCGMTMKKAVYIKDIANSEVEFHNLYLLSDEEIIKVLTELNGVGQWTAEMLLIFSLMRQDVLSYGDLAIHKGIKYIYGEEKLNKKSFLEYKKMYSPYSTIASFYLWEVSNRKSGN